MSCLRGPDRNQVQLLPAGVEDYVAPNSPARFIEAFVELVDYQALGFKHAQPASTGRPPYHPADLLALYLYGYLNRIGSSRRLEAEAKGNLELIWLLRSVQPDFKTIADFGKDNREVFKGLFRQFNLQCRKMELFGAELVAIGGAKFKAVNNSRRNYSAERLQELIQTIDERIEKYLSQLDAEDEAVEGVVGSPTREGLKKKIEQLKETKGQYNDLRQELKKSGQNEISLTDPDCRRMKAANGGRIVGYNVQIAVDAKQDLIVAQEVIECACDRNQLTALATEAKKQLEVQTLKVVADQGYHEANELEACEQASIQTFVPKMATTTGQGKEGRKVFPKERFTYDAQTDTYRCPAGQSLHRRSEGKSKGKARIRYANAAACQQCALAAQCTSGKSREIGRRTHEAVIERAAERVKAHPEIVAERKTIVEHPFGSLRQWGHDHFLMRGRVKVRAEFSLSALVYNLRRVINLVSLEAFKAAGSLAKLKPAMG